VKKCIRASRTERIYKRKARKIVQSLFSAHSENNRKSERLMMAAYATFKHVELYNIGAGKKRVLKPPGGGSSDIFAGSDPLTTPRSIKNHMKSNIFSEASPAKNSTVLQGLHRYFYLDARRPQGDSHNRLFGEPDRAAVPKLRAGSNIPIGNDAIDSSLKQSNGNVVGRETNGHGHEKHGNGEVMEVRVVRPSGENAPPSSNNMVLKNRVPPGGYSSGLW
jgi:hypothetical protein